MQNLEPEWVGCSISTAWWPRILKKKNQLCALKLEKEGQAFQLLYVLVGEGGQLLSPMEIKRASVSRMLICPTPRDPHAAAWLGR